MSQTDLSAGQAAPAIVPPEDPETGFTQESVSVRSIATVEKVAALERKLEDLQWELENEQIIYKRLQNMPFAGKKKSFLQQLATQKELVSGRIKNLSEQIERCNLELVRARNESMKVEVDQKEELIIEMKNQLDAVVNESDQLQAQMMKREEDLLAEVEKLQAVRYTLSKNILTLNAHVVMLRAEKITMQAVVQQTRRELEELRESIKSQPNQISHSDSPATARSQGHSESTACEADFLEKNEQVTRERDELEKAVTVLTEEKALLQSKLEEKLQQITELTERTRQHEASQRTQAAKVEEFQKELERQAEEAARAKKSMNAEQNAHVNELKARIESLEDDRKTQLDEIGQLQNQVGRLEQELQRAHSTIDDQAIEIRSHKDTEESLRNVLQCDNDSIETDPVAKLRGLTVQNASLATQCAAATEKAEADRQKTDAALEEVERLKALIRAKEREAQEYARRWEEEKTARERDAERAMLARSAALAELEMQKDREISRRAGEVDALKVELSDLKVSAMTMSAQLAAVETSAKSSKAENEALNEALMRTIQQKVELASQVEQWEQDMSHLIKTSVTMQS